MSAVVTQDAEEMAVCQFCKQETPADINFCVACDNQIKCLECNHKTYAGKTFCLKCGKPLLEKPSANQAQNQYERDVEKNGDNYKEHTRFQLTDNAVREIAPYVVSQTMPDAYNPNVPVPPALPNRQAEEETVDTTYEDATPPKASASEAGEQSKSESQSEHKSDTANSNSQLNKYFEKDGNALISKGNDFKGQVWSDQQRNFIILYTQAHKELLGKPIPNKEAYKSLAIKLNLADPNNFTTHVNKQVAAFMSQKSDGLILNTAGEKELSKVLALMEDDSKKGQAYWSRSTTPTKPLSVLNKDDKDKVTQWISESGDITLGELDIRDISFARDYALLSSWIIIHHLKKASAVKWNEAFMFLTTKYKTTAVNGQAFSRAMQSKEGEKFFTKNGEGLFYLTSAGQQWVEDWISGAKSVKKEVPNS
jgi:hypothetical protein